MIVKCKERKKDLENLKKMLKVKKLEPVGLEDVPPWYVDPDPDTTPAKVTEIKKEEVKVEKTKEIKVKDPGALTLGDKIRTALLGKTLAGARKKAKVAGPGAGAVIMAPGTSVSSAVPAAAAKPERGPGWEVASDPTAGVGLAKSAGNAEALARGMGR
jgi:hypothetical protein